MSFFSLKNLLHIALRIADPPGKLQELPVAGEGKIQVFERRNPCISCLAGVMKAAKLNRSAHLSLTARPYPPLQTAGCGYVRDRRNLVRGDCRSRGEGRGPPTAGVRERLRRTSRLEHQGADQRLVR